MDGCSGFSCVFAIVTKTPRQCRGVLVAQKGHGSRVGTKKREQERRVLLYFAYNTDHVLPCQCLALNMVTSVPISCVLNASVTYKLCGVRI